MSNVVLEIMLARLGEGQPALTPAAGATLAEAAAVCLEEQGHGMRLSLRVAGEFSRIFARTPPKKPPSSGLAVSRSWCC